MLCNQLEAKQKSETCSQENRTLSQSRKHGWLADQSDLAVNLADSDSALRDGIRSANGLTNGGSWLC